MIRVRRRAAVGVMVALACVATAACTQDGSLPTSTSPSTEVHTDSEVSAVRLAGSGGRSHHGDDGRVTLTLAAGDSLEVHRSDDVELHPITDAGRQLSTVDDDATAQLTLGGADLTFTDVDVAAGDDVGGDDAGSDDAGGDDATVVVSGVPVGGVPPARFDDWELAVGTPGTPSSLASSSPAVLELDDADVAAALAAAPPPPTLAAVSTVPGDAGPATFAVDVDVLLAPNGVYELDVNTPGTADERPMTVVVTVGDDPGDVTIDDGEPAGHFTVSAEQSETGQAAVSLRADGFDVVSVDRVTAQIRRQDAGGGPGPWNTVLGCSATSTTFQWRDGSDDVVKTGVCPDPYGWVTSHVVSPNLAPDPGAVAAAAGFQTSRPLAEHLAALATVIGATAAAPGARSLRLAVDASVDTGAGLPVRVPVLLVGVDAASFDVDAAVAAIDAWRSALGVGATSLVFDVELSSPAVAAPLLMARGVELRSP